MKSLGRFRGPGGILWDLRCALRIPRGFQGEHEALRDVSRGLQGFRGSLEFQEALGAFQGCFEGSKRILEWREVLSGLRGLLRFNVAPRGLRLRGSWRLFRASRKVSWGCQGPPRHFLGFQMRSKRSQGRFRRSPKRVSGSTRKYKGRFREF